MKWSSLSQQLELAVGGFIAQKDISRSEAIGLLHAKSDASRSTVRQDLGGYIKRPDPHRLKAYAEVLGWPLEAFLKAAEADGIEYDLSVNGQSEKRGRESARDPNEIAFQATDESESWDPPDWEDWQEALDIDTSWNEAPQQARQTVASTTAFGRADADTFGDARFYPLTTAERTLVFGALDSAWRLAGRSPDPEGLRSTLETLAQDNFDHSFQDDESSIGGPSLTTKGTHEGVDLSPPEKIINAAEAFLEAKSEGMVPDSCGTGKGTERAEKIAADDLTWKDFLTRDNGTPIPAYLNSHEDDVSADGPPTEWGEEEWSDCGNAQYAAWGFYPDWFKEKANELARARDEEEPYKSESHDFSIRGAPMQMDTESDPLQSTLDTKSGPQSVQPFRDKILEDDTEFKGAADAEVKDVDRKRNIVEVYYAAWTKDAADDRFQKGAFAESIKKYGPQADNQRIVQLNQHSIFEPVGRPIKMVEDDHGLKSQTLIAETRLGEDILELYAAGVLTEHSVGFKRLEEEETDDGVSVIKKALLLEGSNVTWGANSDTPFVGFKDAKSAVEGLMGHLSSLRSALRENLTQRTARKVEHGIKTAERRLERVMQEVAKKAEDAENANADAIKKPDLDEAVENFKNQLGAIREGNATEKSDHGGSVGIEIPDISLGESGEEKESDIDTDYNFFGD